MSDPAVLYELRGHVVELTLNRPENRNSMTDDVLEGLRECVSRARAEKAARCVIVTGRGRSFCGGADLKAGVQREAVLPPVMLLGTGLH